MPIVVITPKKGDKMKASKEIKRVQVLTINGRNVIVETMWKKINGEMVYFGMKTIQVLD